MPDSTSSSPHGVPAHLRARGRAVIVIRYVTHYRLPFFEALRTELARRGIDLLLIHGSPAAGDEADSKEHTVLVPWAQHVRNRWIKVRGRRLLWQPALGLLRRADLVIVEQASSRLLNYVLFCQQMLRLRRLAFWGHGRNFQRERASIAGEMVKRLMSRRVHWWFAYNHTAAAVVESLGFPPDRITNVQNAIDTKALIAARDRLQEAEVNALRDQLGLQGRHVGVFVGGMYPEKRLGFLVQACDSLRARVPDFEMIFIGKGQDQGIVEEAIASRPWMHYVGLRVGEERVAYLALADVLLMPGLVGLAVLDAFALGIPLITTGDADHSPEIEYLHSDLNGLIVPGVNVTEEAYAEEVARLLNDPARLDRLSAGSEASRDRYSIEEMTRRFADGVEEALRR